MQDDEVVVVPDDAGVQSAWPAWKHLLEDLADARPPPRSVLARRALRFCVGHVTRTRPQIRPRPFWLCIVPCRGWAVTVPRSLL